MRCDIPEAFKQCAFTIPCGFADHGAVEVEEHGIATRRDGVADAV
jgi:hypothetical protein